MVILILYNTNILKTKFKSYLKKVCQKGNQKYLVKIGKLNIGIQLIPELFIQGDLLFLDLE